MFERFSQRARRTIFWSLHYARRYSSSRIEPEHILEALLFDDPQLFRILQPENPSLVQTIATALGTSYEKAITHTAGPNLPLSDLGKDVILVAAEQQEGFGHPQVANQHLLLALLLSPAKSQNWFLRKKESKAQRALAENGVTAELIQAKTRGGIITPTTWIMDDAVVALNGQLGALAEVLIRRGVFTREEFVASLDKREGPLPPETFLHHLIETLEQRGLVTADEQAAIKGMAVANSMDLEKEAPSPDQTRKTDPAS